MLVLLAWGVGPLMVIAAYYVGRWAAARALRVPSPPFFGAHDPISYFGLSALERVTMPVAGMLTAYVSAALLFFVATTTVGENRPTTTVNVVPGAAQRAGMRDGDTVVRVNQIPTPQFDDVRRAVMSAPRDPVQIDIRRSGAELRLNVHRDQEKKIGIVPRTERQRVAPGQAVVEAMKRPANILYQLVVSSFAPASASGVAMIGTWTRVAASIRDVGSLLEIYALFVTWSLPCAWLIALLDRPSTQLKRNPSTGDV